MDGTNLSGGSGGSYIDTTSDFVPTTGSFTISFWHKPLTTFAYLISRGIVSDPLGGMGIWSYTDGAVEGYHAYALYRNVGSNSSSTAYARVEFSDSLSTSNGNTNWYHIVVSYNSSNNTVMFMRNGAVGTTQYRRASDNATGVFSAMNSGTIVFGLSGSYDYPGKQRIGNRSNSNSGSTLSNSPYTGFINQLRVFNKAVTSTEGTLLSNETIGTWTGTTNTHLLGCVANYNLDNSAKESMGTTAYDGTESNISYKLGKFGAAASFNGSSSYIDTNYTLPSSTTFTWSGWIKTSNTKNTYICGDFNAAGANAQHRFAIRIYSSSISASVNDAAGGLGTDTVFGTYAHYGVWAHIAVTVDGTSVKMYINGSQFGSTGTSSQSLAAGANPLALGMYGVNGTGSTAFDGLIDQVRIYNTALTASNISTLYAEKYTYITKNANQPFGDSSCKAYYKFENNSNDSIGSFNATNTNVSYLTNNVPFGTYSGSFAANAYYDLGSSFDDQFRTASAFGVSVWYQHQAQTNSYGGKILSLLNNIYLLIQIETNNTMYGRVGQSDGSTFPSVTYSSALEANLWYHIVFTGDSTGVALYLNGNLVGTSSWDGSFLTYTDSNYLYNYVGYQGSGVAYLKGRLDQMRFFNRKLTGTEAVQLHEELVYG